MWCESHIVVLCELRWSIEAALVNRWLVSSIYRCVGSRARVPTLDLSLPLSWCSTASCALNLKQDKRKRKKQKQKTKSHLPLPKKRDDYNRYGQLWYVIWILWSMEWVWIYNISKQIFLYLKFWDRKSLKILRYL